MPRMPGGVISGDARRSLGNGVGNGALWASGPVGILQSLDGIVTNMATVQRETQETTKEILASSESAARLMGDVMDRANTMLATINAYGGPGGGGAGPIPPKRRKPGSITTVSSTAEAEPAQPRGTVVGTADTGLDAPVTRSTVKGVSESVTEPVHRSWLPSTWAEGKRMTLGDVRQGVSQNVSGTINQKVSEWGSRGTQVLRDQHGRYAGTRPAPLGAQPEVRVVREYGPNGETIRDENGNPILNEIGSGGLKYQASAIVKNVAGQMAGGEGLGAAVSNALPTVGKALGVAGMVYTGANQALDFAEGQRQQNMAFQSVLGGSNAEGFGERWQQNLFRLSNRGLMGGADAELIYKSAMSNFGMRRGMRDTYQGSAVDLYKSGVGAEEATRLLNQAAKMGNEELTKLSQTITGLAASAREAGVSYEEARAKFSQAMSATQAQMGGGQQIQASATATRVAMGYGPQFQDTDFTSGQNTDMATMLQARALGVPYAQYLAALNSPEKIMVDGRMVSGAMGKAMAQDTITNQAIQRVDPSGQIQRLLQEKLSRLPAKEREALSYQQMNDLAMEVQAENPGLIRPYAMAGAWKAITGVDVNPNEALTMFAQARFNQEGTSYVAQQEELEASESTAPTFSRSQRTGEGKWGKEGAGTWIEEELGYNLSGNNYDSSGRIDPNTFNTGDRKGFGSRSNYDQLRNLLAKQAAQGKVDPLALKAFQEFDQLGEDARFGVQTPDGKRYVTAKELFKNYADQVASDPTAIDVYGGSSSGMSLREATGMSTYGTGEKAESATSGPVKGKRESELSKDTVGTVQINMSNELRRWFTAVPQSGNVRVSYANGQQPPAYTDTNAGDRARETAGG